MATQYREIAEKLGVSDTALSRWLNGHRNPSRESMLHIEEVLGWPVDEQMHAYNVVVDEQGRTGVYGRKFKEFLRDKHGVEDKRL